MLCVRKSSKTMCFGTGTGHVAEPVTGVLREAFIKNPVVSGLALAMRRGL